MYIRILWGLIILGVTGIYALVTGKLYHMFLINGFVGLGLWAFAGLLSGTFSDQSNRQFNFTHNSADDTRRQTGFSGTLLLLGLPSVLASLLLYIFVYR
ncbi:DUF5316 domain-containing protein [Paenibacillus thiaminolyticus]|uniref:DUF5316 domain-containing protein n=1 Tax=Paenibacillus thiaminolyticus TaxID=49283 RepID=A0A3A3GIU3_PANTH|nr:DUF5316 domain-containing protein [Paenibacillus thiaminolyticus]RJG24557.1 hypothetical protein DQX05_09545 [Paenibacillus thiaminolyticus]